MTVFLLPPLHPLALAIETDSQTDLLNHSLCKMPADMLFSEDCLYEFQNTCCRGFMSQFISGASAVVVTSEEY